MIFPTDVSYWWDIMLQRDIWSTKKVRTYRGDVVTSNYYRKFFEANNSLQMFIQHFSLF